MLQDVIATTENCRYCLMCRHVGPVELVTHREAHSPHGWALLVASVRRGLLEWNEETVGNLYTAPDGGNSRAWCVTSQPLPEALAAARAEVAQAGLAPQAAYKIQERVKQWRNPYREEAPQAVEGQGEHALFVGDAAVYLRPQTLAAARRLLAAAGVEPVLVGVGRNNAFFPSSLGFPETALAVARENLEELQQSRASRLFVLSPGDYFAFRQLYEERLDLPWPEKIRLQEVTVFLAGALEAGKLAFNRSEGMEQVAYVDPTHAVRVPIRHEAPRRLLQAVLPADAELVELFWRRERAHPAGNTALQFTRPEIAEKLTRARLNDAQDAGAEVVVCDDPETLVHLERYAGEYGLEVQGLYELLVECLQ
ncbi:MAG: (Fe-S)-binding protein [Candidatus Promineifilaceae bacterium]|nr:(Fe-S)-binding protein [Candidatus Promineifilaceae bacterium]